MAQADAKEFAEFGAAALDSFQALFEETEHLDHRTNDDHARELLSDLLIDLMHYADHRGLEFDAILDQANGHYLGELNDPTVLSIGSTVQLQGPAADEAVMLGRPTRGSITGVLVPHDGPTEYHVSFLGQTGNHSVIAADLKPAPPFPQVPTTGGIINDPLQAEKILVEAMTRIARADIKGVKPRTDDLNDHRALLDAFATWTDMDERAITDPLLAKVEPRLTVSPPAAGRPLSQSQLATRSFPTPQSSDLSTPGLGALATGPASAPARCPGHGR